MYLAQPPPPRPPRPSPPQLSLARLTEDFRGKERLVYGLRLKLNHATRRWLAGEGIELRVARRHPATGDAAALAEPPQQLR